jgi:DNA-binding NtrC family response regulator
LSLPPELPEDDTQEEHQRGNERPRRPPLPFLFVALEADRPFAGGARLSLEDLDEVSIGRGERGISAEGPRDSRRVALRLPGRAVSASHARLLPVDDGWSIEDAGSTNGIYVNGVQCTRATLGPDDVVEVGRTFLMVRRHATDGGEPPYLDGATLVEKNSALATLLPATARRLEALEHVATSPIPLLLSGETGTGKEVLARAVHERSGRSGPFVAVNCATLTESLGGAQLFGHVRGAFSGAVTEAPGFIRGADGGTLLLDEVQELNPASQAALLRVLQEHEVVPLGGIRPVKVNVRVIATSPQPLDQAVKRGTFRPDLFARLSGFSHRLDTLRDRREDLGLLIAALLRKHGTGPSDGPRLAPELAERLLQHSWPLNIRELEQLLRRALLFAREGLLEVGDLFSAADASEAEASKAPRVLSNDERALKEQLLCELSAARGNIARVARTLGKAPVQIRRWLKRFHIDIDSFR